VHDPWHLLETNERVKHPKELEEKPWTAMPDIIHRYKLQRNPGGAKNDQADKKDQTKKHEKVEKDVQAETDVLISIGSPINQRAPLPSLKSSSPTLLPSKEERQDENEEEEAEHRFVVRGDLFDFDSEEYGKPVLAKCPPRPSRRRGPSEAHLYISPAHSLGKGNHSFVYKAELELPRSMLVEPELCDVCLEEAVQEYSNEHGDEMDLDFNAIVYCKPPGKEAECEQNNEDSPSSDSGARREETKAGKDKQPERMDTENEDSQAQSVEQVAQEWARQLGAHIRMYDYIDPGLVVHPYTPQEYEAVVEAERQGKTAPESTCTFELKAPRTEHIVEYDGMVHELDLTTHPKAQWQSPDLTGAEYCEHLRVRLGKDNQIPQTATVSITAKLSIQHDKHLAREAANYANFPSHFFEDWTGYNFIDHTMGPVPVHAVVPQFYGYYLPEEESKDKDIYYLSPILLLENCGKQIDPKKLSLDEK
jgi:hypothetical protein